MDVRCERCSTEYEFDDALVSGRGTTVKCTNCGHKFKIRRPDGDFSEDFWNVRTRDGRTLVFTSLRELQRAIQSKLVDRADQLSRGGLAPKNIGAIPELAPFFDMREPQRTLPGTPEDPAFGAFDPKKTIPNSPPVMVPQIGTQEVRPRQETRPDFPPLPATLGNPPPRTAPGPSVSMKRTLHGTGPAPHEGIEASSPPTDREPVYDVDPAPSTDKYGRPVEAPASSDAGPAPPVDRFAKAVTAVMGTERTETSVVFELPKRPSRTEEATEPEPIAQPALATALPSEIPPQQHVEPSHDVPEPPPSQSSPSRRGFHRRYTPTPMDAQPPPGRDLVGDGRFDGHQRREHVVDVSSPLPLPSAPARRTSRIYDEISEPTGGEASEYGDEPPRRRRGVGGFLVAVVVLVGVGILAAVWARDHLGTTLGISKPPPAPTVDVKVAELLAAGEKALAEGNLDLAKESFDRASGRAERDPVVLVDLARLAAARADELWLKSRLLPSDAPEEAKMTRDLLGERVTAAHKASADAFAAKPDDPNAVRVRIDALRIGGDRDGARALVGRLGAAASAPESAYVLAALDLAEPEPLWSTVLERLRVAASAETGPGRARAALVYALVRSGDVPGAKLELERLASMPRPHALALFLRAYTERGGGTVASAPKIADAGVPDAAIDAGKDAPTKEVPGKDPRGLVLQAEHARAKGQWDKASQLYAAALDRNPNDTEALSGLAAIAHSRRDLNGARASYKRVLSINPSYVPALVGLADVEWDAGDKAAAMKNYKEIVDRFPEGSYPNRVRQRIGEDGKSHPDAGAGGG